MSYYNPYHKLGLQRNPFTAPDNLEIPPQRWFDFGFSQAPPIQKRLFLQVIGEKGAGKTSHLLHWKQQTGGVYYYCQPGWKAWLLPPVAKIVYWDEANRIPLPLLLISLWLAHSINATIVSGTHNNLAKFASLFSFEIKTIRLSTLCVENLLQWSKKLIESERLSPSIPIRLELTTDNARKIVADSQGSWRKAATFLHIWAARVVKNYIL
ncbi:MAG: hypothetical protein ACFB2X_11850 [Rivularia sp. (in: cyanobacteria)]